MGKMISTTLENICGSQKGAIISGPFGSNISSKFFIDEGIPVIRGNNLSLSLDKFYDYGFVFVSEEKANELNCYAKIDDLIFTAAGTIGQVGIITSDNKYEKYVISNKQIRVTIDKGKVDPMYAYYWFSSPWIRKKLCVSNKGSTVPLLTLWEVKSLPITYPESFDEQRKIVAVFETIGEKIKKNNIINSELEAMARTIYDYWFLQFDFPDENGKPYKSSGGKMVWNETLKRKIPEGWKSIKLDTLCSFSNGINYDKNQNGDKDYRIVNVRNISSSSLLLDVREFDVINLLSTQAEKYIVDVNDILIARSGTPGAVRLLVSNEKDVIYCGFIIKCSPYEKQQRLYLTYALKKLEGSNATKTGGSIMQNVSQETLKQVEICLPPSYIIDKYNMVIEELLSKMQQVIYENQELISLRDYLLPLLMNGQVGFKEY